MKKDDEDDCYTVEREFLGKINTTELVGRIIKNHIKNELLEQSPDKTLEQHPEKEGD